MPTDMAQAGIATLAMESTWMGQIHMVVLCTNGTMSQLWSSKYPDVISYIVPSSVLRLFLFLDSFFFATLNSLDLLIKLGLLHRCIIIL